MTMCHDSKHCHGLIKAFEARKNNINNNDKQMPISKSIFIFFNLPMTALRADITKLSGQYYFNDDLIAKLTIFLTIGKLFT